MTRTIVALALAALVAPALPAQAGPNGGSPSFFPLPTHRTHVRHTEAPHALLGDAAAEGDRVRALRPGVTGKYPARAFLRRPSEGR